MQVVISRQRIDGTWPHVGTTDRILLHVRSELGARSHCRSDRLRLRSQLPDRVLPRGTPLCGALPGVGASRATLYELC